MSKKINITRPLQGYILEKIQGDKHIPPATGVFCGSCGGSIGITKEGIEFPFRWEDLEQNMRDTHILVTQSGVTCQHCDHTVSLSAGMKFTALENYVEWFKDWTPNEKNYNQD